jgi:hypothetical protein
MRKRGKEGIVGGDMSYNLLAVEFSKIRVEKLLSDATFVTNDLFWLLIIRL